MLALRANILGPLLTNLLSLEDGPVLLVVPSSSGGCNTSFRESVYTQGRGHGEPIPRVLRFNGVRTHYNAVALGQGPWTRHARAHQWCNYPLCKRWTPHVDVILRATSTRRLSRAYAINT